MNTATVRSRSWYSSMSRLMNVGSPVGRALVQRRQLLDDAGDGLVERPHRELAGDRRDLDRDVVDVVALEQLHRAVAATGGFALAEHGLAEEVEVEAVTAGSEAA